MAEKMGRDGMHYLLSLSVQAYVMRIEMSEMVCQDYWAQENVVKEDSQLASVPNKQVHYTAERGDQSQLFWMERARAGHLNQTG
ncbi:hypothetical protein KTT_42720 [Tengunoibacter tsumagoiensis]|uniref:Uncharacterized protein n=1 Tax=Tengunoibacter tsumagoiensis TaxID=2014871 RepID=A0A402A5J3_9CHLR|nr:hypothetical protein KTT_42720 [Tengunoibacter tsumagoiensis]